MSKHVKEGGVKENKGIYEVGKMKYAS